MASTTQLLLRLEDPAGGAATDRQLLEAFVHHRDQAAFAAILYRHGAMVYGVCKRLLGVSADADDAVQATFLVLVRKASSATWHASIGGWLHAVAYRVARKARANAARVHSLTSQYPPSEIAAMPDADPLIAAARQDLSAVLDEELARLPAKYRLPLVLCYLEGWTNEEAAQQLGWTKGTVSGRLARARDLLRQRLSRRQLAMSAVATETALGETAAAGVLPAPLFDLTLKAAFHSTTKGAPTTKAATLAEGVCKTMFLNRLKWVAALTLVMGVIGIGGAALIYQAASADPDQRKQQLAQNAADPSADKPSPNHAKKAMTDVEKLQGDWHLVSAEFNGKQATKDELEKAPQILRIKGDEFAEKEGDFWMAATMKIDWSKTPKSFDLISYTNEFRNGVKIVHELLTDVGILELDGDTLKIARAGDKGPRPTGFKTTADTKFFVATYKRGEPPAKPDTTKQPEFVEADITVYWGRDGVPDEPKLTLFKTIKDKAIIGKFVKCFPEAGRGKKSAIAGGWIPRVTLKLTGSKGEKVTINSTWTNWSEGHGDFRVKDNLMKYAGELFDVGRLIDQGNLMDDWRIATFEEGGKNRDTKNLEINVTPNRFELLVNEKPEWSAEYSLAVGAKPKQIDIVIDPYSNDKKTYQGIYSIEKDQLKICFDKSGKQRPTEFKSTPGNADEVLIILKRN